MNIKLIFKRLGLPKNSDLVYLVIEKQGGSLATEIIKKTPVHRPATYRALKALLQHNYIFCTKIGKRQFYHASDRQIIAKEFTELSNEVSTEYVKRVVAKKVYLQKEIKFLDGEKGITATFADVVTHTPRGATFYCYTSEKDLAAVNRLLPKNYRELRDGKKLERLVISNPVSGRQKRPRLERFIKFIPPEAGLFEQNIIQLVYGDRIALIDLNALRVIIIENRSLADFQKIIFRQLYQYLPK